MINVFFTLILTTTFVLLAPRQAEAAVGRCEALVAAASVTETADVRAKLFGRGSRLGPNDVVTTWLTPIEMGFHDKYLALNPATGERQIMAIEPEGKPPFSVEDLTLTRDAPDASSIYYASMSVLQATGKISVRLYDINQTAQLNAMVDKHLDLTWSKYAQEQTVSGQEIESFKKTEGELAVQRKINFITTDLQGRTLTVMRVYDGTPFPALFLGDYGLHNEAPDTDARLPIERRYPGINFRTASPYIFETGRLAKVDELDGALEYQLSNFGAYLMRKFGMHGIAPRDFTLDGRMYIEITPRHLAYYQQPHARGGPGFILHAVARTGHDMTLVTPDNRTELLDGIRRDPNAKAILYLNVIDVVNNFYMPVRGGDPEEARQRHEAAAASARAPGHEGSR